MKIARGFNAGKPRPKIMLVDDNMTNLSAGKNILKEEYQVYPLPSAAKLFEFLEHVQPDMILLDIDMPEMNGFEAIKKLKENSKTAEIPVIFLTAMNDTTSEEEGRKLGAVDYVRKPFDNRLIVDIKKYLPKSA
jgi:putative two-component system response regulator